ncbi:MAG TPA: dUTP diphosphatase [Rhodospirillales bacterium]|nr:dUTP diphosphatase [Rhodospirillales bacterium]
MAEIQVPLRRLANLDGLDIPRYATDLSAGADLVAAIAEPVSIDAGERALIPTGIALALAAGYEAQVRPRSGLALKHGVTVLNSPGTIDADYRGEIGVILINHGADPFVVERGMRIAQLILAPVVTADWAVVDDLPTSARAAGGFGSTGDA